MQEKGEKMIDANVLWKLSDFVRTSNVTIRKFKLYIPRTWNGQLDDILEEAVNQASKGFRYLQIDYYLEDSTIAELVRRGFNLAPEDNHFKLWW